MKVSLICREKMKKIIEEILKSKDFEISSDSKVFFVEKGMEGEINDKVFISFDIDDLNSFIEFIEVFQVPKKSNENVIAAKLEEAYEIFPYNKIQFFEADNNNVFCIIENEKTPYKVKEKLYELDEKLDKNIFIRVSKSNIVNIMNISQIIPWFSSKLLIKFKGTSRNIEVTRTYLKEFKKNLGL